MQKVPQSPTKCRKSNKITRNLREIQKIPQKLKTLAIRRCFGREIHLFAQEDPAGKTQPGEKLGRGWRSKNFIIVFSWVQILPRAIILKSDYLQFVQRFILFNRISFRYKVLKGIRDDTHAYSTLYQWKKQLYWNKSKNIMLKWMIIIKGGWGVTVQRCVSYPGASPSYRTDLAQNILLGTPSLQWKHL